MAAPRMGGRGWDDATDADPLLGVVPWDGGISVYIAAHLTAALCMWRVLLAVDLTALSWSLVRDPDTDGVGRT